MLISVWGDRERVAEVSELAGIHLDVGAVGL
jgi:hypothetical protein